MIAADEYITRLAKYLKDQSNVTVFENTLVTNVKNNEKEVSL